METLLPDEAVRAKMAANSTVRPSTAAELDELELREARLMGQVIAIGIPFFALSEQLRVRLVRLKTSRQQWLKSRRG